LLQFDVYLTNAV